MTQNEIDALKAQNEKQRDVLRTIHMLATRKGESATRRLIDIAVLSDLREWNAAGFAK